MIVRGRVTGARAGFAEVGALGLAIGDGVRLRGETVNVGGTVRAIAGGTALVALHGDAPGITAGVEAARDLRAGALALGTCALGRAIDASGAPLDGGCALEGPLMRIGGSAPPPEARAAIAHPFWTGVRSIDGLLTLGRGARAGCFGAPGAGKSTLLSSIVAGARADAVVVGLVGERGREAQEWIARIDRRTTIVCATSDRAAAERARAAGVAVAQAEALARRGLDVLLVLDSLARYAAALRELGVAAGEPPGRGGYPPGVFAGMAALVERCGNRARGSITLLATVLSDGDERDPVSDAARSLLDAHIALSPALAHAGRFPAIDVLASASRTMSAVVRPEQQRAAARIRSALAVLERSADARSLGIAPQDPETAAAVDAEPAIEAFLRQRAAPEPAERTLRMTAQLADTLGEPPWTFNLT